MEQYQVTELSNLSMQQMYGKIAEVYNVSSDCICGICDCACFGAMLNDREGDSATIEDLIQ